MESVRCIKVHVHRRVRGMTENHENVPDSSAIMIWQPLLMCSITSCFSSHTDAFSRFTTAASSAFSPLSTSTRSSRCEIRSSFLFLHLVAARRFRIRFRSSLIFSWSSISIGDTPRPPEDEAADPEERLFRLLLDVDEDDE